jgi:exopolysaccharide biosynthesis polyprenyl glycosylphosphotransferase
MTVIIQRSLAPLLVLATAFVALHQSLPVMREPFVPALLALMLILFVLRPIEREMRSSSQFRTRVLVIGNHPIASKIMEEVERSRRRRYTIVGVVEEAAVPRPEPSRYLILGTIDELRTIVAAVKPDLIVLAMADRRGKMPAAELLDFQAAGIIIEEAADAYERVSGKLPIEVVTPGQLIASRRMRASRALVLMQRIVSFSIAAVLLALTAPLLAIIALAIRIDSGSPVLFRQTRLGKRFRPFGLIKFRTMRPADRPTSEWANDNSSRITAVGKLLRRLRLDELPQLINVLCGDMNLVGPRPHPVTNLQLFRDAIPYYVLRGSILPGITGWAQVRYHYANNLEEETEKMRYDLYYIKHMSLWTDAAILFDTFKVFLSSLTSSPDDAPPKRVTAIGPRLYVRTWSAHDAVRDRCASPMVFAAFGGSAMTASGAATAPVRWWVREDKSAAGNARGRKPRGVRGRRDLHHHPSPLASDMVPDPRQGPHRVSHRRRGRSVSAVGSMESRSAAAHLSREMLVAFALPAWGVSDAGRCRTGRAEALHFSRRCI